MSSVLKEVLRIKSDNTSLIRLGDVHKHYVDDTNQHSVFKWFSRVCDDRNNVESFLSYVDKVSS